MPNDTIFRVPGKCCPTQVRKALEDDQVIQHISRQHISASGKRCNIQPTR
ncbi:hypothetical protein M413DRAFT_33172 [Hebeloma cylindrosporum]|uniref:Uncharacterized protein n=1 Tax=Hebeloma cylindrosporum TaxID=76867 RepID=A0A0C2X9B9_HEBCY|nr:hypothetical protein M413DRAFT_33172 [Hebeloma cylindrosporum h7]